MSESVILPLPDGATYTIPDVDDEDWGQNVTDFLVAIPSAVPPRSGTFSLTGDLSFGASFGLKSLYFKSLTANISTAGILRLAKTDSIGWRNNANSGNLLLAIDGSDNIMFNGVVLATPATAALLASANVFTASQAITKSASGADLIMSVSNTSNTASSSAIFELVVAGGSAFDPYSLYVITGGLTWAVGADNSAGDSYKISKNATLGTNDFLIIDTNGFVTLGVTGCNVHGTITNDSAPTGYVGEYVTSYQTSTAFPTSTHLGDLTTIALSAGDWDITALAQFLINGATLTTAFIGISVTSGDDSTGLVNGDNYMDFPTVSQNGSASVPNWRLSLSAPSNVYLKYVATYATATPNCRGRLSARRRR